MLPSSPIESSGLDVPHRRNRYGLGAGVLALDTSNAEHKRHKASDGLTGQIRPRLASPILVRRRERVGCRCHCCCLHIAIIVFHSMVFFD